jgi:hypothetical protein
MTSDKFEPPRPLLGPDMYIYPCNKTQIHLVIQSLWKEYTKRGPRLLLSRDVTYQTLPVNNLIIPGQREFGKWHPGLGRENHWQFFTVQSQNDHFLALSRSSFSLCGRWQKLEGMEPTKTTAKNRGPLLIYSLYAEYYTTQLYLRSVSFVIWLTAVGFRTHGTIQSQKYAILTPLKRLRQFYRFWGQLILVF